MKVLIIGASGLVGGNTFSLFKQLKYNVIGTYNKFQLPNLEYFDPFNKMHLRNIEKKNFDAIIYNGALTNVEKCEIDPDLSHHLTFSSAKILIDFCSVNSIKFIYPSTDYVFDGLRGPYTENDNVNPINVYGKHKLKVEEYIQKKIKKYLIVRITNVYGNENRQKNFINSSIAKIKSEKSVSIKAANDQYSTPVCAQDISYLFDYFLKNNINGLYHFSSTDYMNRVQILQAISKVTKYKFNIIGLKTNEMNQIAKRPLRGGLLANKFFNKYSSFITTNIYEYLRKK